MSTIRLVALTSFAGLEGRIRESESFETTESRAKELVRLKLAKAAEAAPEGEPEGEPEKEEKKPRRATKEEKAPLQTKADD